MSAIISAFGIDWRLLIIDCINFGLLLFLLQRFLYAPMMAMLEKRRAMIEQGVVDARRAAHHLAETDEARSEVLAQAGKEADEVLSRARTAAARKEKESAAEAEAAAARVAAQAQAEARELKERAITESKQEIAKLVVLGTEKLLREKATA